jgi:hypothetical protein
VILSHNSNPPSSIALNTFQENATQKSGGIGAIVWGIWKALLATTFDCMEFPYFLW